MIPQRPLLAGEEGRLRRRGEVSGGIQPSESLVTQSFYNRNFCYRGAPHVPMRAREVIPLSGEMSAKLTKGLSPCEVIGTSLPQKRSIANGKIVLISSPNPNLSE